jgi:organic radical activating enzyme
VVSDRKGYFGDRNGCFTTTIDAEGVRPMRWMIFGFCVLTALGCGSTTTATDEKKAADKPAAADVTVKILSLADFQALVASHKGKIVVVDCWSTT